jgi:hypothetical protein
MGRRIDEAIERHREHSGSGGASATERRREREIDEWVI